MAALIDETAEIPAQGLRMEQYFAGRSRAWGIFQDRFGTLRRSFDATLDGRWDGTVLTLTEDFVFDDGKTDQRIWKITPVGAHGYEATANDVLTTAKGTVSGTMLTWSYDFSMDLGDRRLKVHFKDLFVLMGDGMLINRSLVSKWGIGLGHMTIVFRQGG